MTTKATMSLAELAEKGADTDLLRDMIQFVSQRMMEMDTESLCAAAYGQGHGHDRDQQEPGLAAVHRESAATFSHSRKGISPGGGHWKHNASCPTIVVRSPQASGFILSALIGAVAGARSMTPMAGIAAARFLGRRTPGRLVVLERPVIRLGCLVMGVAELFGDKMTSAPDRTVSLGLVARVMSAGIAGAALAPRGRERAGAATAVATAVPLAYLTLAGRRHAMSQMGQTRSGLIEDALVVAAGLSVVALAVRPGEDR